MARASPEGKPLNQEELRALIREVVQEVLREQDEKRLPERWTREELGASDWIIRLRLDFWLSLGVFLAGLAALLYALDLTGLLSKILS